MDDLNLKTVRRRKLFLGIGLLVALVALAGWWIGSGGQEEASEIATAASEAADSQDQEPAIVPEDVTDDGTMLWVSPTSGSPLAMDYLPAGTQLLLQIRPAALAQHAEGEKVLAAMGPSAAQAYAAIQHATGAAWTEMEELLVAVVPQVEGQLELTWRLRLVRPWSTEELARRFPSSSTETYRDQVYQKGDLYACFLPPDAEAKMLVVCPVENIQKRIDSQASPPPLPRDFQKLLTHVDSDRIGNVVLLNRFLETSGTSLLAGRGEPLRAVLRKLFEGQVTAVALSIHWDQNFFWELRCTPTLNHQPHAYADQLRSRLQKLAEEAEETVGALSLHPFGSNVASRFPEMLRMLNRYARFGTEDRHVVLRGYLPRSAGHNLLMASELLLNRPGGETSGVVSGAEDRSIDERLDRVTSLVFVKETLQRALELLSDDMGISIQIAGRDLQLEGITKNQSLALNLRDRPTREILLEILLRTNPDRTATGPTDPRQQLVYVVRTGKNGAADVIVVTTRTAADRRGETLPAAMVIP